MMEFKGQMPEPDVNFLEDQSNAQTTALRAVASFLTSTFGERFVEAMKAASVCYVSESVEKEAQENAMAHFEDVLGMNLR